jgi:hypothetical protein
VVGQVTEILDRQRGNTTQTPEKRKAFNLRNKILPHKGSLESKYIYIYIYIYIYMNYMEYVEIPKMFFRTNHKQ